LEGEELQLVDRGERANEEPLPRALLNPAESEDDADEGDDSAGVANLPDIDGAVIPRPTADDDQPMEGHIGEPHVVPAGGHGHRRVQEETKEPAIASSGPDDLPAIRHRGSREPRSRGARRNPLLFGDVGDQDDFRSERPRTLDHDDDAGHVQLVQSTSRQVTRSDAGTD